MISNKDEVLFCIQKLIDVDIKDEIELSKIEEIIENNTHRLSDIIDLIFHSKDKLNPEDVLEKVYNSNVILL